MVMGNSATTVRCETGNNLFSHLYIIFQLHLNCKCFVSTFHNAHVWKRLVNCYFHQFVPQSSFFVHNSDGFFPFRVPGGHAGQIDKEPTTLKGKKKRKSCKSNPGDSRPHKI